MEGPSYQELIKQLRLHLEYEEELGIPDLPGAMPPPLPSVDPQKRLDAIRAEMGDCTRCKLCHGRTHLVFGVGNPHARLMFVGEGPGRDEDLQGEPFVGRAGQLLDKIIGAMRLKREDVYIGNVIKCRPPENRTPEPDEIATCFPFLIQQIEAIHPEVIVALGNIAIQALLQTKAGITKLRGQFHDLAGIALLPTYHPAFLLRNPNKKREVWEDMKKVMEKLGLKTPFSRPSG